MMYFYQWIVEFLFSKEP